MSRCDRACESCWLGSRRWRCQLRRLFYANIVLAREMNELACDDCRMFNVFTRVSSFVRNLRTIVSDGLSFFAAVWRCRTALAAENLFLRKQLALFREREKKAMPTTPADRFVFSKLARWFDWRSALLIVKPATLIGWHRNAFRLFWRWKSRPVGRPRVTVEVRELIRHLAAENPTWGERRIADELLLKLQIRLSPRTVPNTASNYLGHAARETSAGPPS